MFWKADPTVRLIRQLFGETMKGLNPFAEESRQESRISLLATLIVIGIFTSFGALMPFFFGVPRLYAIEAFWSIQNELLLKFTAMIGIFSVLRWEPFQEGIVRHRFFLSIISSRRLILASQCAQLLFVLMLSFALNIVSDLLYSIFVPEKLGVGIVFFFFNYLLVYSTLALLVFFLIQTAILCLRILHLSGLRYLLLSYLTAIIVIPDSLLRQLFIKRGVVLIPFQSELENMLRKLLAGEWRSFLTLGASTLIVVTVYLTVSAFFMQRRLIDSQSEPSHRMRSRLAGISSRLMLLRPGLPRAVSLHLLQSFLANRQLRTLTVILLAILLGTINSELLSLAFFGNEATGWGIQGLSSSYYFIVQLSLGLGLYYLLKLSIARRHAWLFQLAEPHALYWSFKKALLIFLNLSGILLCLALAPFLIVTGGVHFSLKHILAGSALWSSIASWHALSTEYIPFTAVIEQDKILFKRLWLFYLIVLYFSAGTLSAIVTSMTDREALWLLPLQLSATLVSYYALHRRQKDRVSIREPEYELSDSEVLVGFASE